MARRFRYRMPPDEVKAYLSQLGYETEEKMWPDGRPSGFKVCGTNIELAYDIVGRDHGGDLMTFGKGMISLNNNPYSASYKTEQADASLALYLKLYRRFSKPPSKPVSS